MLVCERLAREVAPRLAHAAIPRIVVSFGVNDTALENGTTRVSREESITALRGINTASGPAELMLIGPPAVDDDAQNERISALSEVLKEESQRLGIPFFGCFESTVDDFVWRHQVREGDGFHPDAAGYEQLATIIQVPLLEWLTPHAHGASQH